MIQEQYEAAARASADRAPPPKPGNAGPIREPISEEFPEDRPKKRQRLSQVDNEEPKVLPEITVGDSGCAEGEQSKTDAEAEVEAEEEITCAVGVVSAAPMANGPRHDAPPETKVKEIPRQVRASSLPPVRRRSARLNLEAQDVTPPGAQTQTSSSGTLDPQHHPTQPAGPGVPSTPTRSRRQTIPTIQPGSSSPLSDPPSQISSPSRTFDLPPFLQTSSPLSDPPSHLGISSPFSERPTIRPTAFPSSSSVLSDPPSHLSSSTFLSHLAPVRSSSPLSDPPSHLPSSPPIVNRRVHLSLKSSPALSPPPETLLCSYGELHSRQNTSRESSPSPETREPPNSQDTSTSNSSLAGENRSPTVDESSQSDWCDCSQQGQVQVAEEIHCAPGSPERADPPSQQSSSDTTQSREAAEHTSSNPVSSQGSTTSARLPIPNIKGRDLFDASIWACPIRTSVFYTFATTLRQKARDVTPTSSHLFISHLRDRGKLVRCYTQNIDRIEEKVGLSTALDRGPGHRSRFSRRAPALSRVQSGASDAPAPHGGLRSSAPAAQSGPRSSLGMFILR